MMLLQTIAFLYIISKARLWLFLAASLLDYSLSQNGDLKILLSD